MNENSTLHKQLVITSLSKVSPQIELLQVHMTLAARMLGASWHICRRYPAPLSALLSLNIHRHNPSCRATSNHNPIKSITSDSIAANAYGIGSPHAGCIMTRLPPISCAGISAFSLLEYAIEHRSSNHKPFSPHISRYFNRIAK